jgi:hypothetical protein
MKPGAGATNICGGGGGGGGIIFGKIILGSSEFKFGKTIPFLLHIKAVNAFTM